MKFSRRLAFACLCHQAWSAKRYLKCFVLRFVHMCALVWEFSSRKLPLRLSLPHPFLLLISLLTWTVYISASSTLARALTGTMRSFLLLSIICLIHSISPWWFLHSRWGNKDPAKLRLALIRGCECFCMILLFFFLPQQTLFIICFWVGL